VLVEVLDIRPRDLDRERLSGFHIDLPTSRTRNDYYAIQVAGWVVRLRSESNCGECIVRQRQAGATGFQMRIFAEPPSEAFSECVVMGSNLAL
jgi:hypothetical protein